MTETTIDSHSTAQTETHVGATERPGVTVVTNENFNDYVDEKLGVASAEEADPVKAAEAAEAAEKTRLAEEAAKPIGPKEGDVDGNRVYFRDKWVGKHDFNYRLHVQTEAKQREYDEKIAAAAEETKAERTAREKAEREAAELKAKYEPAKPDILGPEPKPEQFQDISEYAAKLKEWATDKARLEDKQKAAQERIEKSWAERRTVAMKEIPDLMEKINAATVQISPEMQAAILESEVGPKLLYHLAAHQDEAEAMGKLTVGAMLREIGKLEAKLSAPATPATASPPDLKLVEKKPAVELSKAPEPISPLRGSNAPPGLKMDSKGEWIGTYEEFKKAVNEGLIK